MNLKHIVLYVITVIILFSIPLVTILSHSKVLNEGREFLFKVEAFDPYDMLRGNYLQIRFEENTAPYYGKYSEEDGKNEGECYVTIGVSKDGFAHFTSASYEKSTSTLDYFKTTGYYNTFTDEFKIETPTRYYMNENKSELAEDIYRENIDNAYVKVRVKDGKMVIVGVYINGTLIDSMSN